ncbi:hypothetical protein CEXT_486511 [Caerostris extrusa]|uniref:Uncharacterized protein n=1 Tax=Caerostris extrusa TaxID=172846 RepID=A0AAV4ST83_CAEEX|nr:hypothetical protein CEXT_486511 [Caerostris extrusa]
MIWKYLFGLLAFFRSHNPGPSEYPPEVLEPWGMVSWDAAQKALHQNYYGGEIKVRPRSLVGNSVSDKTLLWENKKVPYVISDPSIGYGAVQQIDALEVRTVD